MFCDFFLIIDSQYKGLEQEITRRPLTHSAWDLSSSKDPERRGWHPLTYKFSDATEKLIQDIKVQKRKSGSALKHYFQSGIPYKLEK